MRNRAEISDSSQIHQWERGWEEHQTMQLKRMARLSLSDKIEWLEQAHRLVRYLKAANSARG